MVAGGGDDAVGQRRIVCERIRLELDCGEDAEAGAHFRDETV